MVAEYDVAISFAGEDRPKAESLADFLVNEFGLTVFYDDFEQATLWGSFLPEKLVEIYRDKAGSCVVLVSEAYKRKRFTTHEWRAAQERALNEPSLAYILPVRLDDTVLDGMFDSVGYVDGRKHSMRAVARLVYEKIGDTATQAGLVRLADQKYREGLIDDALEIVSRAPNQLDIDLIRVKANSLGKKRLYAESVEAFEAIIEQRPSDFLAHFHVAIYSFRLGDFDKAVIHYEVADRLSPGHPTVLSDLEAARAKQRQKKRKR
ncbi:MAG: TIR domain-containing protein [Cypionkella sp.]